MSVNLVRKLEKELAAGFVGREEEARVAILALLTKQHAAFIGEPGTAKSALVHRLARLVKARYFFYLLSKYTVPDEIIGAIDPIQYRQGRFVRITSGKLPTAEIAFLDEVFKASTETLNTLLTIMNERLYVDTDGTVYTVPLWSLYGASNEVPTDSEAAALYDRFLLRHFVKRIDITSFEKAIIMNALRFKNGDKVEPICSLNDIAKVYDEITDYFITNINAIAKTVTQLVAVLRQHGVFISDRTGLSPLHLPRLVATYAYVYNVDLRKASIAAAKYVLPSEEALEAYRKVLDTLIPPEIREAQEKLEKAKDYAVTGDLASAKRLAAEALQAAQSVFSKPEKVELYKDELAEIVKNAENLISEIRAVEEQMKKFKRER